MDKGKRKQLELTPEQQVIVEENINLVYFYAEKFVNSCTLDREEIQAVMMYGLCKAVATWNSEKSKLSTYATRCMRNELFMQLRQEKKWKRHAYLSDIAKKADQMDDEDAASWDAFMSNKEDVSLEERAEINITVERLKTWIAEQEEYMNPTTKKVVQIWIENPQQTQAELANITKVSQAQVSRILTRVKKHIISTFFRGDENWLYGGDIYESELSNDFMDLLSKNRRIVTEEPNMYPIEEVLITTRKGQHIQLGFKFDVS